MLHFNVYPPQQAGDVELGGAGTVYDLDLVRYRDHALVHAKSEDALSLLGMMVSHSVSEPRIADETIDAQAPDSIEILKPVIDQVGKVVGEDKAIWFARGIFHGLKVDFPDFREVDDWEQHKMFQTLIRGISDEAATAIARREDSNTSSPISS